MNKRRIDKFVKVFLIGFSVFWLMLWLAYFDDFGIILLFNFIFCGVLLIYYKIQQLLALIWSLHYGQLNKKNR